MTMRSIYGKICKIEYFDEGSVTDHYDVFCCTYFASRSSKLTLYVGGFSLSAYIFIWISHVHFKAKNLYVRNKLRITQDKGLSFFIV